MVLISCVAKRDPAASEEFLGSVRHLCLDRGRLADVRLHARGGGQPPLRVHGPMLHMCSSLLSKAMANIVPQGDRCCCYVVLQEKEVLPGIEDPTADSS